MKKILSTLWSRDNVVRDDQYYESLVPHFPFTHTIPLAIHQTYHKHELPADLAVNVERLRGMNPDCEYTLWNDADLEEYILKHYGETIFKDYYKRITPTYGAAKADLFRYLLIYRQGGLYLDIKSSLSQPLRDLISSGYTAYLSHWDNQVGGKYEGFGLAHKEFSTLPYGEYVQWYLCFSPGHPLLRRVIIEVLKCMDRYNPYTVGVGQLGTLYTTGPVPYTRAICDELRINLSLTRLCLEVRSVRDLCLEYTVFNGVNDHIKNIGSYRLSINPVVVPDSKRHMWIHKLYLDLRYVYLRYVRRFEVVR